jgi:hypothetical protein
VVSAPKIYVKDNGSVHLKGNNVDRLYSAILADKMVGKPVKPLYQYSDNGSTG